MTERIGSILSRRLRHYQVDKSVTSAQIVSAANEVLVRVLPSGVAPHVKAISVHDGMLLCEANQPAVAQECKFYEQELVREIKKKMPNAAIHHLRFRLQSHFE